MRRIRRRNFCLGNSARFRLKDNIVEVRDIKVHFPVRKGVFARTIGHIKAVDGVTFVIHRGETLGVVGESGSGKSTLARVLTGLVKPTAGEVSVGGKVAMVFQDPLGSLNPRMTVFATVGEALAAAGRASGRTEVCEQLELVGLDASQLDKYPHEFSGGQRQRICIARAIAGAPELLICDEAVSALDLSIRSQVLELLRDLKQRLSLSMMFITHDLGVVQHMADRVIVMRGGKIEEEGPRESILKAPRSGYTRYLMDSVPKIGKPLT